MREIFVCSMLLMAGIDDMKRNRISNCIVIPAIILSVIYKVYFDGFLYAMRGIKDMTLICLIFLPVFKLRGIGAGDIKLFCMITGFYGFIFGISGCTHYYVCRSRGGISCFKVSVFAKQIF